MRRRPRRKTRKSDRRKRRPGRRIWPWLGLGALGLAALGMRRPRPVVAARSRPAAPKPPPGELPADAGISWVSGPAGSLRIAERHPEGRLAIVFVHGLGGSLKQWSPQIRALGPALRAVAFDLPGHGSSDPAADGDYSMPALAAAIGAVADSLALRRLVVVGHSLGALAAIDYAARHPRRVAGVLMVDPSGDQTRMRRQDRRSFLDTIRRDPAAESVWYFRQLLRDARPEVADQVMGDLDATAEEAFLGALEGAASYPALPALERYPGPVASVVSELNSLPYSLHRLRPELAVRHLYGASHWLMMDRPEEVLEALWDFLEEVES